MRLYDPERGAWSVVWASGAYPAFDQFTATARGDDLVMYGERAARAAFGAHRGRITFHEIGARSFSWSYDGTAPGADGPWQPVLRVTCTRA